jgi:hypothetical protein
MLNGSQKCLHSNSLVDGLNFQSLGSIIGPFKLSGPRIPISNRASLRDIQELVMSVLTVWCGNGMSRFFRAMILALRPSTLEIYSLYVSEIDVSTASDSLMMESCFDDSHRLSLRERLPNRSKSGDESSKARSPRPGPAPVSLPILQRGLGQQRVPAEASKCRFYQDQHNPKCSVPRGPV